MNAILGGAPIPVASGGALTVGVYNGIALTATTHTLAGKFNTLVVIGPTNSTSLYVWNTHTATLNIGESKELRVYFCDNSNAFNGYITIGHPSANQFTCTALSYRTLCCTYMVIGIP